MDVVIIGAGGHGQVVADILASARQHRVVGFLDADESLLGTKVAGIEVLAGPNQLGRMKREHRVRGAIVAIGDNRVRARYAEEVLAAGLELVTAIHPSAVVASSARVGAGTVIAAGSVVCVSARIGENCIINTSAVVDHECEIGAAVHVCPGALLAGRVKVGERAFIGLGARVIQCLSVGSDAVVGAGSVVLHDVPDGAKVVGVPARRIDGQ